MRTENSTYKCDYCHNVVVADKDSDGVSLSTDCEADGEPCPICALPLMKATLGRLPLLVCTKCDGMLIAMQEFQDLIAASRAEHRGPVAASPANSNSDALRRRIGCPHCHRPMEAHFYGGAGNVVMDTCEGCSLNWLDHGELARIANASSSSFAADSDSDSDDDCNDGCNLDQNAGYTSNSNANFDADHSASYFTTPSPPPTFNTTA
jgi:Zn-finger nucleic acid-binding protein